MSQAGARIETDRHGRTVLIDMASDRVSADDRLLNAASCFPGVKTLRLAVNNVGADSLRLLKSFCQLEELFLQDVPLDDKGLAEVVGANPELRRVTLRRLSSITDAGVQSIAACPHVEVVALIEMSGISGASIQALRNVKTLRALDLRHSGQLGREDYRLLADWKGLSDLKIGGPGVDDAVLAIVADLPALQSFSVEDAEITNEGLGQWVAHERPAMGLTGLTIARCYGITDEGLTVIGQLGKLSQLALRDLSVTGSFLTELAKSRSGGLTLTRLTITNGYLTDDVTACFADLLPRLKQLDLRGNLGVTDVSAERIRGMSSLEHVRLEETGVTSPPMGSDGTPAGSETR